MPGVYDLTYSLVVPRFVDVEGAGPNATVLRRVSSHDSNDQAMSTYGDALVQNLRIEATNMRGVRVLGEVYPGGSPTRLDRVVVKASGNVSLSGQNVSAIEVSGGPGLDISNSSASGVSTGNRGSGIGLNVFRYTSEASRGRAVVTNCDLYGEGTEVSAALNVSYSDVVVMGSRLEAKGLNATGLAVSSGSLIEALGLRIVADGYGSANAVANTSGSLIAKDIVAHVTGGSFATAINLSLVPADQVLVSGVDAYVTASQSHAVYASAQPGASVKVLGSSFSRRGPSMPRAAAASSSRTRTWRTRSS
jgi:hypothetical protein